MITVLYKDQQGAIIGTSELKEGLNKAGATVITPTISTEKFVASLEIQSSGPDKLALEQITLTRGGDVQSTWDYWHRLCISTSTKDTSKFQDDVCYAKKELHNQSKNKYMTIAGSISLAPTSEWQVWLHVSDDVKHSQTSGKMSSFLWDGRNKLGSSSVRGTKQDQWIHFDTARTTDLASFAVIQSSADLSFIDRIMIKKDGEKYKEFDGPWCFSRGTEEKEGEKCKTRDHDDASLCHIPLPAHG